MIPTPLTQLFSFFLNPVSPSCQTNYHIQPPFRSKISNSTHVPLSPSEPVMRNLACIEHSFSNFSSYILICTKRSNNEGERDRRTSRIARYIAFTRLFPLSAFVRLLQWLSSLARVDERHIEYKDGNIESQPSPWSVNPYLGDMVIFGTKRQLSLVLGERILNLGARFIDSTLFSPNLKTLFSFYI